MKIRPFDRQPVVPSCYGMPFDGNGIEEALNARVRRA